MVSHQTTSSTEAGETLSTRSNHVSQQPKSTGVGRDQRAATFKDYLRVFTYASNWDFLAYGAGVFSAAGCGATTPLMYLLFGNFVNVFSGNNNDAQFGEKLNTLCLYMFALFIARLGLATVHKLAFRMIGIRLSSAIRLHYIKQLLAQSIHVLDSLPPGHAATTIASSSNTLQLGISEQLGVLVEYTALIIGAIVVAFIRSWELALVTSSGIIAITLVVGAIFPFVAKGQARQAQLETAAAAVASESFASIRMVMACGAEHRRANKYGNLVDEATRHGLSTSPITSLQFALTFFGVFGNVGLTLWYGARAYTQSRVESVGVITAVLLSITTVFFSLDKIASPMQAVEKATLAACEFFSVIDAPLPQYGHLKAPNVTAESDIIFKNVTFAYPSRPNVKIFDHLDLVIEAGKTTAIVGPSGSGKSTIVALLERWYTLQKQATITEVIKKDEKEKKTKSNAAVDEISEEKDQSPYAELKGSVSVSGRSIQDIDLRWWRSQIGLVQQEPFLFDDTIHNNVAHGLIGSEWEYETAERKRSLVMEACKEAFADEFINKLPEGYDTWVGNDGAKLSGGQRQRIAIARSIIKKPAILILDEATSAIDVRGERIVQAALEKAARGRTTIVIAHRISTIRNANRIIVLKSGKVVESGTHDSLVRLRDGVYAGLVKAQTLAHNDELEETIEHSHVAPAQSKKGFIEPEYTRCPLEEQPTKDIPPQRGLFTSFGVFFVESRVWWKLMACSVVFAAAAGAARPVYAWLFAKSIDVFKYEDQSSKLMGEVSFLGGMWTVFAVSAGLVYFLTFICSARVASLIRSKYQKQYFETILCQPASYFHEEGHSAGTLASRAKDDPMKLEDLMGINMAMVLVSIFNIIASVIMALIYAWKLALVSICVITPVCLISGYFRFRYELQFEKLNDEVFSESSKFASEAISGFRTVSSLMLEDSIAARFERLCSSHVMAAYKKACWVSPMLGFCDSATIGCQALVFYYGGQLFDHGEFGLVAFFVCLMAIMSAAEGFGQSLSLGPNAAQVTVASNRILDAKSSCIKKTRQEKYCRKTVEGMEIEFRNVKFVYPNSETPIFSGLSLTIEKGQFAAVVGASGSGKTTVITLLERFYEPEGGSILVDGQDIAHLDLFDYRQRLALVAQESMLLEGTIRDNILLGIDDPTTVTTEQLYNVCRDALIHEFIISLPDGYDTVIGSRGVSLSGGQRQRISIARALIRNPQVLLLDEATSSLDSESENLVQQALERAGHDRTIVSVAHRLVTVQNADVIFVLGEGGHLLERGSHIELIQKKGVYFQMCQSQAVGNQTEKSLGSHVSTS